ncbi:MAG: tetratricopeptide repeat protein [Bryobacteraceae bacterium]|nr:tetratricopeptide repeat protein [Bryobacteraceae bacterium]
MNLSGRVLSALALISFALSAQAPPPKVDKGAAYYNYAMAHLYSELAQAFGNRGGDKDYLNTAIEHYRAAIKADPNAAFLAEELSELYIQTGQIRTAVTEAEEAIKRNPADLNSRRVLGRLYSRMIGDRETNKINEGMLKKAIEQYQKIAELSPKDLDTWLMLGRLHKVAQSSPESEAAYKKALEIDSENEDASIGLAMVYSDLGDNAKATELLEKASRKSPNLRTLTTLASNYEQLRDYKLAAETLRRAIDLSPGNADLRRAYAQNLLFGEQLDEALKIYKELVDEDARDTQSLLRISQIYRQQRKFDLAREASNKAREIEPNNLEIRYNEVSLLEAEGKLPEAIAALREVLEATSKRSYGPADKANRLVLVERLGLLYRQNEQTEEAVDAFRQMAAIDPDAGARSSAQVIETYRAGRDYKRAIAEADAAKEKYPADRMVKLIRANLLAESGRAPEGAADVRTLLDGKSDREVYLSLAQIYEKAKDYREMGKAIDEAEKLSKSPEEKENLHFMRGAMFEKMKKYDAAESEFRKVLAANPDNASALNYLGYMLADRGVRLNEALAMIQKALEHDPDNGAYLDSLGWVYFRLDRVSEAETALLRAIERAPKDPTVHDHLGDVYLKQGNLKDAIAQWERSVGEWKASAPSDLDPAELAKVQKKLDSARVRLARESPAAAPKP